MTFLDTLASALFRLERLCDTKSELLATSCARAPLPGQLGELVIVKLLRSRKHLIGSGVANQRFDAVSFSCSSPLGTKVAP